MESSTQETTVLTKPCTTIFSSVDNVVRAILKCLGFEQLHTLKDSSPSSSSSESDQQRDGEACEANSFESDASSTTAPDPASCTDLPTTETSGEAGHAIMIPAKRSSINKGEGPSIN